MVTWSYQLDDNRMNPSHFFICFAVSFHQRLNKNGCFRVPGKAYYVATVESKLLMRHQQQLSQTSQRFGFLVMKEFDMLGFSWRIGSQVAEKPLGQCLVKERLLDKYWESDFCCMRFLEDWYWVDGGSLKVTVMKVSGDSSPKQWQSPSYTTISVTKRIQRILFDVFCLHFWMFWNDLPKAIHTRFDPRNPGKPAGGLDFMMSVAGAHVAQGFGPVSLKGASRKMKEAHAFLRAGIG